MISWPHATAGRGQKEGGMELIESLNKWLTKVYPLLESHSVEKIEADLPIGKVTAYWAGTIIRIDLKPVK